MIIIDISMDNPLIRLTKYETAPATSFLRSANHGATSQVEYTMKIQLMTTAAAYREKSQN